jgi:hypothetical protein
MTITFVPPYGPPGPSSGWQNDPSGDTPLTEGVLDDWTQATMDVVAALNEILAGPLGSVVINYLNLPVGTTAGTVAAGDDSRFVSIPTVLNNALLCVIEVAGVYGARPVWPNPVVWIGTDTPTGGGTVTSGTTAVDGFDVYIPKP